MYSTTLHDAFLDELRDLYHLERHLTDTLPRMASAATAALPHVMARPGTSFAAQNRLEAIRMYLVSKKEKTPKQQGKKPGPRIDERSRPSSVGREHEGATEDQIEETPAPAGRAFEDEPRQG